MIDDEAYAAALIRLQRSRMFAIRDVSFKMDQFEIFGNFLCFLINIALGSGRETLVEQIDDSLTSLDDVIKRAFVEQGAPDGARLQCAQAHWELLTCTHCKSSETHYGCQRKLGKPIIDDLFTSKGGELDMMFWKLLSLHK